MIKPQRDFTIETIMAQNEENCCFLKDVAWKDLQIIVEQMICRDLKSMIPRVSTSSDIISGGFVGRMQALAEWSKCQESPKKDPWHERRAKQATKACARRKASQKLFEVLASMPVGFTGGDENFSETSSTSTHFKRKKSKKNDVDHHHVTRSLTSSGSSGLLHIEGGLSHVEQVLSTNEGHTVEE
jgi:hypothetical protein